ncbi:MAG: transporter permease [Bacilli bacterium]|jgi:multiple sugar transport system permease protein|nr:transporter permease [Bacilli bacterium]
MGHSKLKAYSATFLGILFLLVFLFPVYWMVKTSITPNTDMYHNPPYFFPIKATLESYMNNFIRNKDMIGFIGNSFIIALGTMVMSLLLAVPAAYAVARLKIKGKAMVLIFLLVIQMLPSIMMAMPLFIMFSKVNLVNNFYGLIFADMIHALPFAILVLRPFFMSLPNELEDAAKIDGCNKFTAFAKIILPLVRPGLLTVGVFCFLFGWGDFIFALTLTSGNSVRPLTLGLYQFIGQYGTEWNSLMAVSTLAALPIVIIFVTMQKYVVGGIAAGSMKE